MANQIFFGVGCFHFWPSQLPPFILKIDSYTAELRKALESVPAITDIQIDVDEETPPVKLEVALGQLSDGEDFLPLPSFLEISFSVYVPFRIQQELADQFTPEKTRSENFRVTILYAYEAPVSFVEPLNPTGTPDGSEAVQVVREYLLRHINSSGEAIRFDSLGPSPFHADFCLSYRRGTDFVGFRAENERIRGYDKIRFVCHEISFDDLSAAKEDLFSSLKDEFGIFYQLMLARVKAIDGWLKIQAVLTKLGDAWGKRGFRQRLLNIFLKGRYINELITAIATFEVDQIFARDSIDQGYRAIYSKDENAFIRDYVDEGLKELSPYPTKQISDLALFLEGRRSRAIELLVILVAALIGGVAGALLTIMFAKSS